MEFKKVKKDYFKVAERGLTYKTGVFFNPETKDEYELTIYDYDDDRVQFSAGEHYSISINERVQQMWLHKHNVIQIGDLVKIERGRKFKGESKRVIKQFTYSIKGMYGRPYGDIRYLVFDDNTKVVKDNCDLMQEPERYSVYQLIFERNGSINKWVVSEYELIDNKIRAKTHHNKWFTFNTEFLKEIKTIK